MSRDPTDPEGEFERRDYHLNRFCAEEGAYEADPPVKWTSPTITDMVIDIIRQREKIGIATYHRPLLAGDGRNTLQDAIEEAADLLQYLVKLKVERENQDASKK